MTTYKFLVNAHGIDTAEQYAQERWDSGELCGGGWNCPIPKSVKSTIEQKKESRRQRYQEEYKRKRSENYLKKYGTD